ncbi:MAG TPA: DUF6569 family protein [Flavitalea sp.]|nr:DUF6569 family protein [Flavitalea sp.]
MKKLIPAIIMALPLLSFSQYTYEQLDVNFLANEATAKNFTYQHLRLYPIKAKESFQKTFGNVGNYMSLKQALESKKVKITEKANGGTVNELVIENISADTIIVIPGEIIKGGKQDRVINQDMVLSPKSGKKKLPVFCVESGRWSSRNDKEEEFNDHFTVGASSLRKVVEKDADQSKVWSKVAEINQKNKTSSSTQTYTSIMNSKQLTHQLAAYKKYFTDRFSKEQNVIGVIAVSGNKILSCDMFATPWLFRQNFENLLASYATDAIIDGSPVNIVQGEVKNYMDKLLQNETVQRQTLKEKGKSFTDKGKKLRVSSY